MKLINLTELILEKVKMNLRAEVRKSYLSYAWWILEPALMVSVFYFIFGVLLRRGGEEFLAFLLCGWVPFQWFSRSVPNCMRSIIKGKGLINQIQIPKAFFPIVTILQDSFKALVLFVILLVVLVIYGINPTIYWLYIIPIIVVQLVFISMCGVFVSMILPFAQDLKFLIATGITALMFGSGIFYDYKRTILPEHQDYFLLNPMANLLSNYREVLLHSGPPDWVSLGVIFFFSFIGLLLLLKILRHMDGVYPRLVSE